MAKLVSFLNSTIQYLKGKGLFDLLFVNLLTQFLSFGSLLLVAKFLSPSEYGEIKIIQSYTGFFIILAGFGFNTAVLKICSENREEKEKDGVLRFVISRTFFSTTVTLIFIWILSRLGLIATSAHLEKWLVIYSFSIPFQVLTGILIVFLQAKKRIKEMARVQAIIKIQSILIIIGCTWIWGFTGFILSSIFAFALGLYPLTKLTGLSFLQKNPIQIQTTIYNYAFYSFLANGVNQLWQLNDIFILDHFSSNRISIGYYSLALVFIAASSQLTGTVQAIATPFFSEHSTDKNWISTKLKQNQIKLGLLSAAVAVGIYLFAIILFPVFYGPEYMETIKYLSILLLKYVIWSSCALIGAALVGLGLMKYNFAMMVVVTPLGFFLSYTFLQRFGIVGVAWAQVISASAMFVISLLFTMLAFKKHFHKTDNV